MTTLVYATDDEGPGPILVDHVTGDDFVVHGAYGQVDVDPHGHLHLVVTWTQAKPYELRLTLTHPHTGQWQAWEFARELLRTGGGEGDVRITFDFDDFDLLWVLLRSPDGQVKFRLDRNWVGELLRATDDIVIPDAEWDAASREIPNRPPEGGCWE